MAFSKGMDKRRLRSSKTLLEALSVELSQISFTTDAELLRMQEIIDVLQNVIDELDLLERGAK